VYSAPAGDAWWDAATILLPRNEQPAAAIRSRLRSNRLKKAVSSARFQVFELEAAAAGSH
jgi:hypothetical protein